MKVRIDDIKSDMYACNRVLEDELTIEEKLGEVSRSSPFPHPFAPHCGRHLI